MTNPECNARQNGFLTVHEEELLELIQKLPGAADRPFDFERRTSPRRNLSVFVKVTPFDPETREVGSPVRGVTCNISSGGICFLNTTAIRDRYLLLEFEYPTIVSRRLAMEVIRCERAEPFWLIRGRLVTVPPSSRA
jgi:hypothetical protein